MSSDLESKMNSSTIVIPNEVLKVPKLKLKKMFEKKNT